MCFRDLSYLRRAPEPLAWFASVVPHGHYFTVVPPSTLHLTYGSAGRLLAQLPRSLPTPARRGCRAERLVQRLGRAQETRRSSVEPPIQPMLPDQGREKDQPRRWTAAGSGALLPPAGNSVLQKALQRPATCSYSQSTALLPSAGGRRTGSPQRYFGGSRDGWEAAALVGWQEHLTGSVQLDGERLPRGFASPSERQRHVKPEQGQQGVRAGRGAQSALPGSGAGEGSSERCAGSASLCHRPANRQLSVRGC